MCIHEWDARAFVRFWANGKRCQSAVGKGGIVIHEMEKGSVFASRAIAMHSQY